MRSRPFGSTRTTMGIRGGVVPHGAVGIDAEHWHGASPTTAMTHMAVAEMLDGTPVQWMEKVTDEQYRGDSRNREE